MCDPFINVFGYMWVRLFDPPDKCPRCKRKGFRKIDTFECENDHEWFVNFHNIKVVMERDTASPFIQPVPLPTIPSVGPIPHSMSYSNFGPIPSMSFSHFGPGVMSSFSSFLGDKTKKE